MVIKVQKDNILLLKDVNISLRKSYAILKVLFQNNVNINQNNINKQLKDYRKCISISRMALLSNNINPDAFGKIQKMLMDGKITCLHLFHIPQNILNEIVKNDIAKNMKRVILSKGNYKYADQDVRFLVKFYLSIETRLCLFLTRKKASFEA